MIGTPCSLLLSTGSVWWLERPSHASRTRSGGGSSGMPETREAMCWVGIEATATPPTLPSSVLQRPSCIHGGGSKSSSPIAGQARTGPHIPSSTSGTHLSSTRAAAPMIGAHASTTAVTSESSEFACLKGTHLCMRGRYWGPEGHARVGPGETRVDEPVATYTPPDGLSALLAPSAEPTRACTLWQVASMARSRSVSRRCQTLSRT